MKKFLKQLKKALGVSGKFLWQNKRNIGIIASTFILPAVNAYFPDAMTTEQFELWDRAAKGLATGGVIHNSIKNARKAQVQKQDRKRD